MSGPLLGALGTEPRKEFSRHRHSKSPIGAPPASCHVVPRALPFSMAPVPLQISVQNWLLLLPRQHPAKAGVRGGTFCLGVEGRVSPYPHPGSTVSSSMRSPRWDPTLPSHREWLQASRMGQQVGARAREGPPWHQCLAPSSSRGHRGRWWASSKPPGQPGLGVQRPALSVQARRSPSGPLPPHTWLSSRNGLLHPRTAAADHRRR